MTCGASPTASVSDAPDTNDHINDSDTNHDTNDTHQYNANDNYDNDTIKLLQQH